jgi:hypothetical protein
MQHWKELPSEKEFSPEYRLSLSFLRRAQLVGGGPDRIECGAKLVKYQRTAIEAWLAENTRKVAA